MQLNRVIGNEDIVYSCAEFIKEGNIPHLIFSGPAGVGKTTIAEILAREIAGPGNTKIINASDDRGIKIARVDIKDFAQTWGEYSDRIKILILDEVDNATTDFFAAIRRIMEIESPYCRFILICNHPHKIIDPVRSRCVEFEFKRISKKLIIKRLYAICKKEQIVIEVEQLKKIINIYSGDLRKCINTIDAIKKGAKFDAIIHKTNPATYLKLVIKNDLKGIRNYIDNNIFSNQDMKSLINKCIDMLIVNGKPDNTKYETLLLNLAEADYRLSMGTHYYSIAFWIPLSTNWYKEN